MNHRDIPDRKQSPRLFSRTRIVSMIAGVLGLLLCMYMVQRCSHRSVNPFSADFPAKSGADTIDVAIEISPLAYSLAGDTISGLDYDILRQMARMNGREVKFHPFAPLQYALDGLAAGNFDIIVAALPSTRNLKTQLRLTDHVYLDREVLVQRADDSIRILSPGELAGRSVWIPDGSPIRDRIDNLADEIGDSIIVMEMEGRTSEHLVMLVSAGEIDRAVVNEGIARKLQQQLSNIDISIPVSFTQFQVWALSPSNTALADSIDSWLKRFKATPDYQLLLERYDHVE